MDVLLGRRSGCRVGDPGAVAARVHDALLQPGVRTGQHARDDLAVQVVGVGPQPPEELVHADAGLPAEHVGELVRLAAVVVGGAQVLGPYDGRAHGEQFGADVHDPAEEALFGLHPALPAGHGVEGGPGQLARCPLHVPQVPGEFPELRVRTR